MDPLRHESRDLVSGYARGTAYRRRIGGAMLIAGGALAFLTLAVPHPAANDELGAMVVGGAAVLIGALLLFRPEVAPGGPRPSSWRPARSSSRYTTRVAGVDGTRGADNEVLYLNPRPGWRSPRSFASA